MLRISIVFSLICFLTCAFVSADSVTVVEAARNQIGVTILYDHSYTKIAYPNGDVSAERGVCTDVIIRALRVSKSIDLQQLVHEDMKEHFSSYPKDWQLKATDSNIDHRRVPNLRVYFRRHHRSLPVTQDPKDYQPGDIVTSVISGKLPHIMIVSDKVTWQGVPLAIHNIGMGTREEDALFEYPITGHYRLKNYFEAIRARVQELNHVSISQVPANCLVYLVGCCHVEKQ